MVGRYAVVFFTVQTKALATMGEIMTTQKQEQGRIFFGTKIKSYNKGKEGGMTLDRNSAHDSFCGFFSERKRERVS